MATYTIGASRHRRLRTNLARETLYGLVVAGAAAALAVVMGTSGATKGVAIVIVVAGTIWFATTRRTSLALAALMLYLGLLDGYLKLSTGSSVVTFVRDGLLYALAFGVLVRAIVTRTRLVMPPLSAWVAVFVVCVLVQLANPGDGSLYHSLAAARVHLEFVPLFFLAFTYLRTVRALRIFVVLLIAIGVINGLVNVVQFNETPQQLAAWGPGYAERVLGLGQFAQGGRTFFNATGQNFTRPFGLGSDSGDGGLMDAFALGGILALASLPGRRAYLLVAALSTAAIIAGVITAQGRAVIVCSVAVIFAYAVLTATSRRGFGTIAAVAMTALVAFVAVQAVVGSSQSTTLRVSSLSATNLLQTTERNRGSSLSLIPTYIKEYPFGAGLGLSGPAEGVSGAPPLAGVVDGENEVNFTVTETGIAGMLAIVGFTLTIAVLGLRKVRREVNPEVRVLLAAIIAPIIGMLVLYVVSAATPTTPSGPYLWTVGGIASYWLIARPAELRRQARALV